MLLFVLIVLSLIVAGINLYALNNKYKETKRESDKIGCGTIIIWLIVGFIFIFGSFFNLIGACGGDLWKIGGR